MASKQTLFLGSKVGPLHTGLTVMWYIIDGHVNIKKLSCLLLQRIHEGVRPFQCSVCDDRTFTTKGQLDSHFLHRHVGVKLSKCRFHRFFDDCSKKLDLSYSEIIFIAFLKGSSFLRKSNKIGSNPGIICAPSAGPPSSSLTTSAYTCYVTQVGFVTSSVGFLFQ